MLNKSFPISKIIISQHLLLLQNYVSHNKTLIRDICTNLFTQVILWYCWSFWQVGIINHSRQSVITLIRIFPGQVTKSQWCSIYVLFHIYIVHNLIIIILPGTNCFFFFPVRLLLKRLVQGNLSWVVWNLTFVFYCIKVREDFLPIPTYV